MYQLDQQVGYKLRLVQQRHVEIFSEYLPQITPMQLSVMVRLRDQEAISQNQLGRLVHMDAATTKGVVDRLIDRGWLTSNPCENDKRRRNISLTSSGRQFILSATPQADNISKQTLKPLTEKEKKQLLQLLDKLIAN